MQKYYTLAEAAEIARCSPQTLRRWLLEARLNMPNKRRLKISEKILERLIEDSVPRIARMSYRPRRKAPAPEGQQTTGGPTKA